MRPLEAVTTILVQLATPPGCYGSIVFCSATVRRDYMLRFTGRIEWPDKDVRNQKFATDGVAPLPLETEAVWLVKQSVCCCWYALCAA